MDSVDFQDLIGRSDAAGRAAIIWDPDSDPDPEDRVMIEYNGTGLVWDGLALWGRPNGSSDPHAEIGIKIKKPSGGSLVDPGKMWFPAIMIDDCATGIYADGALSADSCAFGYSWIRGCDTCVHLDDAGATMFTFRYVHPLDSTTVFKVTGGGRIYVHAINIVSGVDTVLDIQGGDLAKSFFQIAGLKSDAGNTNFCLLNNDDDSDGLTNVRFTDAHFVSENGANTIDVLIDRTKVGGGSSGQTVLEFVGCKGLTAEGVVLADLITIKGASSSKPSRLIVRDSELPIRSEAELIKSGSQYYTQNRIKNWKFGEGLQANESSSG